MVLCGENEVTLHKTNILLYSQTSLNQSLRNNLAKEMATNLIFVDLLDSLVAALESTTKNYLFYSSVKNLIFYLFISSDYPIKPN